MVDHSTKIKVGKESLRIKIIRIMCKWSNTIFSLNKILKRAPGLASKKLSQMLWDKLKEDFQALQLMKITLE